MADMALLTDEDVFGAPVRRRGGMRSEFSPYVAQGIDYDPRAGIRGQDGYGPAENDGLLSDDEVFGGRAAQRRVDVPDATFGSVARDFASGALQIGPTIIKGAADIARLATGDRIGKDTSDAMEAGMGVIRDTVGSERAAAQRQNFQADMADDNVGAWDALSRNKGAIADQILPTLGSMVLPMGAAGLAGKAATIGRAAQGLDKAALASRVASVQTAAGIGATAAQNAADTFAELVDRGVPMADAYTAAGITVPFSVIAGKLTGGGAELAAVRALSGQGAGRGLLEFGKAAGREGLQEVGEETGQITGEAVATDTMPSAASVGKQLGVAGTLGAIVGGGGNVASQALSRPPSAADEIARAFDADVANTRFAASADEIARQSLDPSNYAPPSPIDPVKSIVDGEVSPADRSMLDLLVPNRPTAPAAAPDVVRPPISDVDPTGDFGASNAELTALEAARGIGQAPVPQPIPEAGAPVPAAAQEPAQPAPSYEITESGTLLVNRPISEVRPLAPGAWMIRAPGGGTLVGRTAAPTVQAALDAEAPAASSLETVTSEPAPALQGAEVSRFQTEQPPVTPGATAKPAATLPTYTSNRDGTLIVNMAREELAPYVPDVKLIQTGRGLLVGRTQAAEVAALMDVMHVPQTFKSQAEASAFVEKHWPDSRADVADTGDGWVVMPRPKPETASELAEVAASATRLHDIIQRDQVSARGARVQVVPDADLVGSAGQQAAVLGRAIRAAFNIPVAYVKNLTANGALFEGRVLLDVRQLTSAARTPEQASGLLIAVTGHEAEHAFQKSKDPRDVAINARLANVVRKHLKPLAMSKQLDYEQGMSRRHITRKYAFREIGANLGGGFWAKSAFWKDVYDIDKGSTARRLFYRFMQAATKAVAVVRGSEFDPSSYVTDVAAVQRAYAQATAERLGMRLPATMAPVAAAPAVQPVRAATPQPAVPDLRLQDAEMRAELEASKADIGWRQVGGRILRDPGTAIGSGQGDVVGRTPWLGSDLWRNRPSQGGKVTEKEAENAIDRALRGEPMSVRQRRFVTYTLDSIEDRMTAAEKAAFEAFDEALIEAQDAREDLAIDAAWQAVAEVEAQEERDAIQAQDGIDAEDAGRAGQAAGAAAGVAQEGDNRAQDEARQGGAAEEGLTLEAQTSADLKARAAREQAAAAAYKAEQRRLADKATADAQLNEFTLTGSDRPADVGAAGGQDALFNQPRIDFADPKSAADVLMAWGAQAKYQYPKTDAKDLAQIARDKGATAEEDTITQPDGSEKSTGYWTITLPDETGAGVEPTALLVVDGDKVHINVAGLKAGSGGSRVYDIAAQFALNNGKVFIGDPDGVSDAAMRRRLENMLSSAIKYGTTDHIAPHRRQLLGESRLDLPPLKWQTGDTRGNIYSMLRVSNAVNERRQPFGSAISYDAAAGAFVDADGVPVVDAPAAFALLSNEDRGIAEVGAAGRTTLQRAALFRALLRGEGARRSLLGQLRGLPGDGGAQARRSPPALDDILYSQVSRKLEDERGLIIQHNLTVENLMHAAKMGGIPVPSLAVVKKNAPLTGFGEITLIGPPELADPKGYAGTKVFGADIYSPRYPTVTFDFTPNQRKRLERELDEGMKATDDGYLDWDDLSKGPRELSQTLPFMWRFAKDNGIEPEVVREAPKPIQSGLEAYQNDSRQAYELAEDPEFQAAAWASMRATLLRAYKGDAAAADAELAERRENVSTRGRDFVVSNAASEVVRYRREARDSGKVDRYATRNAIENQLRAKDLMPALEQAARDTFERIAPNERIFRGFSYSGNRLYKPHTLENVVNILKKDLRGGEGFNYGVGTLRAKVTPQFKSIAQIRKSKDLLVTKERFEEIRKEIDAELTELSDALGHTSLETTLSLVEDAIKMPVKTAAKQYDKNADLSNEQARAVLDFLAKLRTLPTEYFEAKVLRDVDVAEFKVAVVPETIPAKARDYLAARGAKVVEYTKGDDADRAAKIQQAADDNDLAFSQSTRPIDPATRYAGVMVEQKILIEDTGQTGTLRLDAGQAIADLDQRAYRMRRLLECLG